MVTDAFSLTEWRTAQEGKELTFSSDTILLHEEKSSFWSFFRLKKSEGSCQTRDPRFPLDVRDLHFSFTNQKILRGFSLCVQTGEVCGVLGPNGCGKSTLFRCCMGLLHPAEGHIFAGGENIAHVPPAVLARHIAYVPQEHHQPFPFSVREMVLMGRTPRMKSWLQLNRNDEYIAQEALERIGIGHLADHRFNQLSGGQRQLTLIARALAQQTPILLLDEPTSSLDFSNQLTVWRVLREIASQGVAILVCCHDPNHLLWFCDRAAIMHEGKIFAEGRPQEVISQNTLQHIYGKCSVKLYSDSDRAIVVPAADSHH